MAKSPTWHKVFDRTRCVSREIFSTNQMRAHLEPENHVLHFTCEIHSKSMLENRHKTPRCTDCQHTLAATDFDRANGRLKSGKLALSEGL